jgi:hypothetical protein
MMALASSPAEDDPESDPEEFRFEDILRTLGQSTIEKESQVPQPRALTEGQKRLAERVGFEPTVSTRPTPVFKTGSFDRSDTSPFA